MKKKLSIIIPVYNNQESLQELIKRLNNVEKKIKKINFEIICVNDCSQDNSLDELKKIKKKIRNDLKIFSLNKNYGSNLASKTGLKFSTGDAHTLLSADLQEPPEIIEELIKEWNKGSKMVIAQKKSRKDPIFTIFFSRIFYFFFKLLINKNYPKNGLDLFLIDKEISHYIIDSDKDIFIPIHLFDLGFAYTVVQYDRQQRKYGVSQWSFKKKLKVFIDIFSIYSSNISKVIILIGSFILLFAIFYSSVLLYLSIFNEYTANGFVTLFVYITALFGIVISLLGIISNQVFRILNRLSKNPETILDFNFKD